MADFDVGDFGDDIHDVQADDIDDTGMLTGGTQDITAENVTTEGPSGLLVRNCSDPP